MAELAIINNNSEYLDTQVLLDTKCNMKFRSL